MTTAPIPSDQRRRFRLLGSLMLLSLSLCTGSGAAFAAGPNILLFLVDDLGASDTGVTGSDLYETPNIDRLAADGVRFTSSYAASPVCSATRASLMTGMYPARTRVTDWIDGMWEHLPDERKQQLPFMPPSWTKRLELRHTTLAEALKANGYLTAHIGKWHLTPTSEDPEEVAPYYPEARGFDVNIAGNQWGEPGSYFPPYRLKRADGLAARIANFPPQTGGGHRYLTDMLTDHAVELIRSNNHRPFFLYMSYYAVHAPFEGRADLVAKYQAKPIKGSVHSHVIYSAMVEGVDRSIGRIRAALAEAEVTDNTVIIFTSDNGGLTYLPGPTSNHPFRGGKGSPYEGGVRIPTTVVWPGVTPPGGISDEPMLTTDWYPTILEITGSPGNAEHNARLDGTSLRPLFTQPQGALGRGALYWHYPHYHAGGATPYSAVRNGDLRLIEFYQGDRVELYNLRQDPGETSDLSAVLPDQRDKLRQQLALWRAGIGAQAPRPNPDYEGPGSVPPPGR